MNTFKDFIEKNKGKIQRITDNNTKRNEKGLPVITKDDPWRKESEWDSSMPKGVSMVR